MNHLFLEEEDYQALEKEVGSFEKFAKKQKKRNKALLNAKQKVLCVDNTLHRMHSVPNIRRLSLRLKQLLFRASSEGDAGYFRKMLGFEDTDDRFDVCYLSRNERLPDKLEDYSLIIISGSRVLMNENNESAWFENVSNVIRQSEEYEIPALFVGFGHQMKAYLNGSDVDFLTAKNGEVLFEFGGAELTKTKDESVGSFFGQLPEKLIVPVAHIEELAEKPINSNVVYKGNASVIQALEYSRNAWSFQGHPEYLATTLVSRMYADHEIINSAMHYMSKKQRERHFEAQNASELKNRIISLSEGIAESRNQIFKALLEVLPDL